ncbi:type IV pilus assembly protein PilN [Hypnocyclicus thermotrophus]|uniref:Type IV pilus assembly protein PilN n=1 Tax=Hypnocyclicus thermotrophus TaxID=1627895 RepID=A0AA46DY81_9FUSO|nr:PilN domain-containing protein [Hypnocyclicus thermotrophus]TDT69788.1 type IV pilus assembly protein PilN [Hypnocyclicus thermotrophus]
MIDINFLTQEYKLKLMLKSISRMILLVILLIFTILFSINLYLNSIIENKQSIINNKNAEIKKITKNIKEVKQKMKEIPDLTSNIQIIEEVFNQKNLRVSEILYTLQENIPSGMWLDSIMYDNNNLFLSGKTIKNKQLKLNPAKNIFKFERNLKSTNRFSTIKADFIKYSNIKNNEVNEFQYQLILNSN